MNEKRWHQKRIEEVISQMDSTPEGISSAEATKRLQEKGRNELTEKRKKGPFLMFLEQFQDFMILILIGAALVAGAIGELSDTIVILVIVIVNAVIGFIQEYRAERAMAALKQMASPVATVVRAGNLMKIAAAELVPGDVVVLETGMVVPADMRLMEAVQLKVEEAALTGESVPV